MRCANPLGAPPLAAGPKGVLMSVSANPSSARAPANKPQVKSPVPGILMAAVLVALIVLAWTGVTPAAPWSQAYDPLGHWWLSTIVAAVPVIVLLGTLAVFSMKAHYAAVLGLVAALLIAAGVFHMPVKMASITAIYGACYGLFPSAGSSSMSSFFTA